MRFGKWLVMLVLPFVFVAVSHAQTDSCKIRYQYCSLCGDPLIPQSSCVTEGPFLAVCTVGSFKCNAICWDCTSNTPKASQPVNLATGDTFISQSDLAIPGLGGGLSLSRTWHSQFPFAENVPISGTFGANWRSTYEENISVNSDGLVKYTRGSGGIWTLGLVSTTWPLTYAMIAPSNGNVTVSYDGLHWTLTYISGETRVFNAAGYLQSIADRNGNTTQLTYDALNRLTTVTDPSSRHLSFTYANPSSNIVIGVSSDTGVSLSYAYDTQGRLTTITNPDLTTISFQYVQIAGVSLISAVLDTNGKVLESHTYDTEMRGVTASRAGGVDAVTVTYPFLLNGLP